MDKIKAVEFSKEYCRLHNAAYIEYRRAFASVGARMWVDDDAMPLRADHLDFIAGNVEAGMMELYTIVRPLTQESSYKRVNSHNVWELNVLVDAIYKKYQALLAEFLQVL